MEEILLEEEIEEVQISLSSLEDRSRVTTSCLKEYAKLRRYYTKLVNKLKRGEG